MKEKLRSYHAKQDVIDKYGGKHIIFVYGELLVAEVEDCLYHTRVKYIGNTVDTVDTANEIKLANKQKHRFFNFGWAICCAEDNFDFETGVKIAKKRFSDSPMETTDTRFFSDDMITAILSNEVRFIEEHLYDKFLSTNYITEQEAKKKQENLKKEKVNQFFNKEERKGVIDAGTNFEYQDGDFFTILEPSERIMGVIKESIGNGRYSTYWVVKENLYHLKYDILFDYILDPVIHNVSLNSKRKKKHAVENILRNIFHYEWDDENKTVKYNNKLGQFYIGE